MAKLYTFKGYDCSDEYGEAARTVHNERVLPHVAPAEVAYALAVSCGLERRRGLTGGRSAKCATALRARIAKRAFYCNGRIYSMIEQLCR
jgi:hypothetical protein